MECCEKLGNVARLSVRHNTMHMAADLKEGDTILVGAKHRAVKITEVLTPFTFAENGGVVRTAKGTSDSGDMLLTFKRSKTGSRVTLDTTSYAGVEWGLQGHFRNTIKPAVSESDL